MKLREDQLDENVRQGIQNKRRVMSDVIESMRATKRLAMRASVPAAAVVKVVKTALVPMSIITSDTAVWINLMEQTNTLL